MATLLVHEAGPQTTVQDLGRRGSLRVGIPPSGPVDREAFVLFKRVTVGEAHELLRAYRRELDDAIAFPSR